MSDRVNPTITAWQKIIEITAKRQCLLEGEIKKKREGGPKML